MVASKDGTTTTQSKASSSRAAKLLDQKELMVKGQRFARWIDGLQLISPLNDIFEDLRTGLLLCKITEKLTGTRFLGLNKKPMSLKTASVNIEKALFILYKKGVSVKQVPTAEEIYSGTPDKIVKLLSIMFDQYVMRDIRPLKHDMLDWYNSLLVPYGRKIQFDSRGNLWESVYDFVAIICIFHRLGKPEDKPNLREIYWEPIEEEEFYSNIDCGLDLVYNYDIQVLWTSEEWLYYPEPDFLFYQLYLIYSKLKDYELQHNESLGEIVFKDQDRIEEKVRQQEQEQEQLRHQQHYQQQLEEKLHQEQIRMQQEQQARQAAQQHQQRILSENRSYAPAEQHLLESSSPSVSTNDTSPSRSIYYERIVPGREDHGKKIMRTLGTKYRSSDEIQLFNFESAGGCARGGEPTAAPRLGSNNNRSPSRTNNYEPSPIPSSPNNHKPTSRAESTFMKLVTKLVDESSDDDGRHIFEELSSPRSSPKSLPQSPAALHSSVSPNYGLFQRQQQPHQYHHDGTFYEDSNEHVDRQLDMVQSMFFDTSISSRKSSPSSSLNSSTTSRRSNSPQSPRKASTAGVTTLSNSTRSALKQAISNRGYGSDASSNGSVNYSKPKELTNYQKTLLEVYKAPLGKKKETTTTPRAAKKPHMPRASKPASASMNDLYKSIDAAAKAAVEAATAATTALMASGSPLSAITSDRLTTIIPATATPKAAPTATDNTGRKQSPNSSSPLGQRKSPSPMQIPKAISSLFDSDQQRVSSAEATKTIGQSSTSPLAGPSPRVTSSPQQQQPSTTSRSTPSPSRSKPRSSFYSYSPNSSPPQQRLSNTPYDSNDTFEDFLGRSAGSTHSNANSDNNNNNNKPISEDANNGSSNRSLHNLLNQFLSESGSPHQEQQQQQQQQSSASPGGAGIDEEALLFLQTERHVKLREVDKHGSKYDEYTIQLQRRPSSHQQTTSPWCLRLSHHHHANNTSTIGGGGSGGTIMSGSMSGYIDIHEIREVYQSQTNPSVILRPHASFDSIRGRPTIIVLIMANDQEVTLLCRALRALMGHNNNNNKKKSSAAAGSSSSSSSSPAHVHAPSGLETTTTTITTAAAAAPTTSPVL